MTAYKQGLFLAMLLCFAVRSLAQDTQPTEKSGKQFDVLHGILRSVRTFGPPGYGETPKRDARVRYLVLSVEKAVFLPCDPNDLPQGSSDCPSTAKLKLLFDIGVDPSAEVTAARLVGRRVVVKGHLQRWTTAADYSPIVIWVATIEREPRSR